jgi:hypothetical protein
MLPVLHGGSRTRNPNNIADVATLAIEEENLELNRKATTVLAIIVCIIIGTGISTYVLLHDFDPVPKTTGIQEPAVVLNPGDEVDFKSKNVTTLVDAVVYAGENVSFVGNHWSTSNNITCYLASNTTVVLVQITTKADKSGQFVDYLIIPQVNDTGIISLECEQNLEFSNGQKLTTYSPAILMGMAGTGNTTSVTPPDADSD